MTTAALKTHTLKGAPYAAAATVFFTMNDAGIKSLSDTFPLHEIVLIRSSVALILVTVLAFFFGGGLAALATSRPLVAFARAGFVVAANMLFFLGLAAMPLADASAVFFVGPMVIAVFSVIFLGEKVGPRRWAAILVGFIGVLIIIRPGTTAFQPAALMPMGAAVCYAGLHMLTRVLGRTDSTWSMIFWIQLMFIVVAIGIGVSVGDGRFADQENASLAFFFRAWSWPSQIEYGQLFGVGILLAGGAWLISRAYTVSEAALVAPFEYIAMPLAIFWGYVLFDEWPDPNTWLGIFLVVGGGLFLMWREMAASRAK